MSDPDDGVAFVTAYKRRAWQPVQRPAVQRRPSVQQPPVQRPNPTNATERLTAHQPLSPPREDSNTQQRRRLARGTLASTSTRKGVTLTDICLLSLILITICLLLLPRDSEHATPASSRGLDTLVWYRGNATEKLVGISLYAEVDQELLARTNISIEHLSRHETLVAMRIMPLLNSAKVIIDAPKRCTAQRQYVSHVKDVIALVRGATTDAHAALRELNVTADTVAGFLEPIHTEYKRLEERRQQLMSFQFRRTSASQNQHFEEVAASSERLAYQLELIKASTGAVTSWLSFWTSFRKGLDELESQAAGWQDHQTGRCEAKELEAFSRRVLHLASSLIGPVGFPKRLWWWRLFSTA
jgi:hypothetical protein